MTNRKSTLLKALDAAIHHGEMVKQYSKYLSEAEGGDRATERLIVDHAVKAAKFRTQVQKVLDSMTPQELAALRDRLNRPDRHLALAGVIVE
jgi:hypothetical protein